MTNFFSESLIEEAESFWFDSGVYALECDTDTYPHPRWKYLRYFAGQRRGKELRGSFGVFLALSEKPAYGGYWFSDGLWWFQQECHECGLGFREGIEMLSQAAFPSEPGLHPFGVLAWETSPATAMRRFNALATCALERKTSKE